MHPNHILEVGRRDLAATRLLGEPLPTLAPGAVRLDVERLALTANTVTYALTGDLLGYWQFYPAPDADWGRVPAMGWARIVESTRPELAVGSRYYGWWPAARFVDVHAERDAALCSVDLEHDDDPLLVLDRGDELVPCIL